MRRILTRGDVFIWLTGAFLALSIMMIAGILLLITVNGIAYFTPRPIQHLAVNSAGERSDILGQIYATEDIPPEVARAEGFDTLGARHQRFLVRTGNREITGQDFVWVNGPEIIASDLPPDAVCVERTEYGHAFGFITGLVEGSGRTFDNPIDAWEMFPRVHEFVRRVLSAIRDLERSEIGAINYAMEKARLEIRGLEYRLDRGAIDSAAFMGARDEQLRIMSRLDGEFMVSQRRVDSLKALIEGYVLNIRSVGPMAETLAIPVASVVRVYKPNLMSWVDEAGFYLSKGWEFLSEDPREANAEGGVFPAIFGTIMMVLIMTFVAVPFGVIAALYLREYAVEGPVVRLVRIAVNNLAGVPSIVFGMFGLGFFVYFVGGGIDAMFYPERAPSPTYGTGGILWASLTLALLTVPVVIVATEEALAAIPRGMREGSLALGATKWETVRRVVLPSATPGIMTGAILAMARGAGEVAPLMITGVVKLATELPFDGNFPFFHLDRKFMHLGFHIYDVGFQTSNVEANIGMVYTTTLLLLLIVLLLNMSAIILRSRLRKKYRLAGF